MYRLVQFGSTTLEYPNQVDSIGSGVTPTSYQPLPEGGALDNFGTLQKHPGLVEYTKTIRLVGATASAVTALYLGLLALRGKRDLLYRRTAANATHWKYARLVEVSARRDFNEAQFKLSQEVELKFVAQDVFWRGTAVGLFMDTGLLMDSGLTMDTGNTQTLTTSPKSITLTVGSASDAGRAKVRSIVMIVSAGNADMSNVIIQRSGGERLTFNGTIAANKTLIIDTGSLQIFNDGVDAYASLVFEPTADMTTWFTLQPGSNSLTVSWTGGGTGASIQFNYYESWY
jgi:hypothetical protein